MYNVDLRIKSHQDAEDFIKKYHTPIATHFYERGHFSNTEHLPTPEEGQEYLDLLLELAKTFPEGNPKFVRYNGACFLTVARLMSIAEIELSERDKQRILDYTTVAYDSDYLNYACQIRDADTMLHCIADFWEQVAMLESYYQEIVTRLDQISALPLFRLIKQFRLAHECAWWYEEVQENAVLISHDYVPRLCDEINSNYQSNLGYTHPLIFYRRPTNVAGKLFSDQQTEDEVEQEWENCDLHRKFGDEKLARLLDLLPGFTMDYFIFHPDTGKQICGRGVNCKVRVCNVYPELEPYYNKFLLFNPIENGDGYISDVSLNLAIQNLAETFKAQAYLPMANYSRRQQLPQSHPETNMSSEELSAAKAILSFIERIQ